MPLYENSVIYKLVHKNDQDNENIYVGSTTNFRGRKLQHKRNCCNEKYENYNLYLYQFIRENGGWNDWEMVAVETYPCENKRELEIRERFHIETLKSKLNKNIPTRTHKEYQKEYYENNHEKLLEYKKQYRQDNREKISENQKQYRQDNHQKILEKNREKVSCECCCILTKYQLKRHRNSDNHKKKMEALAN